MIDDSKQAQLEKLVEEILTSFNIMAPPIPIELILNSPESDMWEKIDPARLSITLSNVNTRYGPRMSFARMLVRHIVDSHWGNQHNLPDLIATREELDAFARALLMPRDMVLSLSTKSMNPTVMSLHFEIPEDEAEQRLSELL